MATEMIRGGQAATGHAKTRWDGSGAGPAKDSVTYGADMTGGDEDRAEVIERVKLRLKAQLGQDIFMSWFQRMKLDSLGKGVCQVSVPTAFLRSWIQSHYQELLTEIFAEGWYDYDAKYRPGGSRHEIPADLPADITEACLDYALRAHRALGCRGLSRSDFRWDDSRGRDGLYLLEVNTQPGMTPTSLAPEQAAHAGIDFPALMRWMVEDALCRP